MDPITAKLMSAAGVAADRIYVDDVFSTFLWEGNSTNNRAIANDIDLSGEGGLTWIKLRSGTDNHIFYDTERGGSKFLSSDSTAAENSNDGLTFNSNGFTIAVNSQAYTNANGSDYCSWTFRKCPGFFDVVTYTGNGTSGNYTRQIAHNLGSVPGFIMVKSLTSSSEGWYCFHRSLGSNALIYLNETDGKFSPNTWMNNTSPTSTHFTVNSSGTNYTGHNYVAYVFAHDDQSFGDGGNEAIIKCGSYTATGSDGNKITLGFEPQWLLIKNTDDSSTSWNILDTMRGMNDTAGNFLRADLNNAEFSNDARAINLHADGFSVNSGNTEMNGVSGNDFIYIAIRRPHKPPEAGSEVVALKLIAGSASTKTVSVSNAGVTDMTFIRNVTEARDWIVGTRLLGANTLKLNTTDAQTTGTFGTSVNVWDQMTGTELNFNDDVNRNGRFYMHWQFTRKHGVFDVVAYDGDGQNSRSITHGLGSAPELVLIKNRTNTSAGSAFWVVHSTEIASNNMLRTNTNDGLSAGGVDSYPTASAFPVSDSDSVFNVLNNSTDSYIAYLFASLSGVSKIGKYTGTGNDVDVDCGFTAGARFVLIKRTDSSGSWYLFDTERTIASGNDSYILLESTSVPVLNQDYIDPLNAGFTITSSAPADLNTSGGTYIFLAIA